MKNSNPTPGRFLPASLMLALLLASLAAGTHTAAGNAYEPFAYPVESPLLNATAATGDGFTTWTAGTAGWVLAGLSYPGLPVEANALRTPAGGRQFVGLDEPLTSGTQWISFLFKSSAGNSGGNKNGVYFPNGGTGLFFGLGFNPFSATQGYLGLGSTNTVGTATQGASLLRQLSLGTYGGTYLVVLKIEFNTAGDNDTVTVYLNPLTNQSTPGVAPAGAPLTTFNVGTIAGFGTNVQGAGEVIVDEIRFASTYTAVVDAVTVPPSIPAGLQATPGANQVALSWAAATGSPVTYQVKRAAASDGPYVVIGTVVAPSVVYTDIILGGTTHYYVVSAVNAVGESEPSAFMAAAAVLAPPAAPSGLSGVPGDAQVYLSWSATRFATSYEVKRAASLAGPYASLGTTADLTFNDTGLRNAQSYFYVVAALGAGGTGPASSPVSVTPFGPLPFVATVEPGVGITWFASNNVTYQVQKASEDLGPDTAWENLGRTVVGKEASITVFDPTATPESVYQVVSY